jgi:hypothetical protein
MVIVLVLLAPGLTLRLAGVTPRVKRASGVMVSAIVTLLVRPPEVPMIVTGESPVDAFGETVNVSVLVSAVAGLNAAVTP